MGKPFAFTENDSVKETWKDSLFKGFFSDRKKVLDSKAFPAVAKGLAFSDPSIKFGKGAYTFKTNAVADKATFTEGKREFQAQFKKDTKKFDLRLKDQVAEGVVGLVKYENRGDATAPHYVVGVDVATKLGLTANAKFNPFTGMFKASGIYDAGKFVPGCSVAADLKTPVSDVNSAVYNFGALYKSPFGTTGLAYNYKGLVTLNHVMQVDKNLSAGLEFVQPTKDVTPANPLTLGCAYKIDAEHSVVARVNKNAELNLGLKKQLSKDCDLQVATVVDASKPDALFKPPSFGFKFNYKV
jgi:hypothetical protein